MKYMMFIKHAESFRGQKIPQGLMDAMGEFVQKGFTSGVLKETSGLKATKEGSRIRLESGKLKVTDGPFTEAKEVVGGFAIVDVKSRQEALDLATQFMEIHRVQWPEFVGECEVRPFDDM